MNPLFITPITTADEAKRWFADMHTQKMLFHPEDDANDIMRFGENKHLFTKKEAKAINARMDEIFSLLPDPCAIAYALIFIDKE